MALAVVAAGGLDTGISRNEIAPKRLLHSAHVIAADSGVGLLRRLNLVPAIVVGDFDSVDPADLQWARQAGAKIVEHRRDKDATDFDLALELASNIDGVDEVVAIGAFGGRMDHFLANMAVLASPRFDELLVRAVDTTTEVWVVRQKPVAISVSEGATLTLLPWGGDAVVTTSGLRWELTESLLRWDRSVGVSNEVVRSPVTVQTLGGVILAMVPKGEPPSVPAIET